MASSRLRFIALGLLLGLPAAHADALWQAVPDSSLSAMRGGFSTVQGLMVSFSIVRTVQIDGQLVSQSSLQLGDLRSITATQAQQLAQEVSRAGLVQSGGGNTAALQSTLPSALVIQNTLNDKHIQSVTELNVISNGMGLLKGINLSRTLSDALGAAAAR